MPITRVGRLYAQEGMAPADFLHVYEESVGRLGEEGRDFRQVGLRLRVRSAVGVTTTCARHGEECSGENWQETLTQV
jgi:hypothetical protein